ncbi:3-dehydroquinate synthase [Sulfurimonas sp.]|uniref:3-dehydroquinate synthase n=1 Tax=Sulfurimonas sp. TaxID=2022749 RepID=UPI0025CDA619|nr:3-dehydroquinate synthase [Sulfurimonas sp.]MDD5157023.1 3-dehydroquinate synthase [Sulfurimonas sp.]
MQVNIALKKIVDDSYDITIDTLPKLHFDKKVAIVTNSTISKLHLGYLLSKISAKELHVITLKDGEEYKNQESIDEILNSLFEHRFNRKSMLIAFGGGVIGDMTGYAASIYQRGIDFIQIPTTLLSQVDASVGGKTGMNNAFGKNLIGSFHQPKAVYIDPYFLTTLPKREFGAGFAEIVKMAVTFNEVFFKFLEGANLDDKEILVDVIKQAVQTKASVVAQDEKEHGLRAALNYGHTFGHVIENETAYKEFLHGEAVAIGMVMANELAVEVGLMNAEEASRVKVLLEKYALPVSYEIKDADAFYELFSLDKKSSDSSVTFILPRGIGDVVITDKIDASTVVSVLNRFGDR